MEPHGIPVLWSLPHRKAPQPSLRSPQTTGSPQSLSSPPRRQRPSCGPTPLPPTPPLSQQPQLQKEIGNKPILNSFPEKEHGLVNNFLFPIGSGRKHFLQIPTFRTDHVNYEKVFVLIFIIMLRCFSSHEFWNVALM